MAENKMYCKLPIPITAYQTDKAFDIETLEGVMHASVGDYIITGVNGEQYPCKPDVFEKTYIPCGSKNKMEQVAALFGKKLNEEFKIKLFTGRVWIVKFTSNGLKHCHKDYEWLRANDYLKDLLTGEAVIVDE